MTAPSARFRASFTTLTALLCGLLILSASAAQAAPFAPITNNNSHPVSVIDTATVPPGAGAVGQQRLASFSAAPAAPKPIEVAPAESARITNNLAKLPLSFEPNHGQSAEEVRFLARAPGYLLQLTATEMRLLIKGQVETTAAQDTGLQKSRQAPSTGLTHALRFTWQGANADTPSQGEASLPGTVNYLKGSDSTQWHTAIPTYERVRYQDLYPGIDLLYYGNGRQLVYDLIVQPGADPNRIALTIEGAEASLTDNGDLSLALSDGRRLQFKAPVLYQEQGGERLPVEGRYLLAHAGSASEVRFEIGAYDATLPLTIDPLLYSTFLGGSGTDYGYNIAVNAAGEAFVTGQTFDAATDFPATAGAFDTLHNGNSDAFVARLNAAGSALLYSTFLGGSGEDAGYSIAVNAANEAFVTGWTLGDATNFPATTGAFNTLHNGSSDAFVARLNAAGSALVYSTFLGGSGQERGYGIAVNATNDAFVTGYVQVTSTGFPTTPGAFDTTHNGGNYDAFVTRLNAAGSLLLYSTFLGGSGDDAGRAIAVNAANEAFVTGSTFDAGTDFPITAGAFSITHNGGSIDAFVTRLNAAGSALVYSTFLGGSGTDIGFGIAVNAAGEAFVTGRTDDAGTDFPATAGAFSTAHNGVSDAFVTRLNSTGSALLYSTFLGGSGNDLGIGIAVNAAGEAFVTGQTADATTDFPTTTGAFDTAHNGGDDAFVTRLNATGSALLYSTFLGGSGDDYGRGIAVNAANEAFVTGFTFDAVTDFPITAGAYDTLHNGGIDAFVAKLGTAPPPPAAIVPIPTLSEWALIGLAGLLGLWGMMRLRRV